VHHLANEKDIYHNFHVFLLLTSIFLPNAT